VTSSAISTWAGCHGDERERARTLAPRDTSAEVGWYVLGKPGF